MKLTLDNTLSCDVNNEVYIHCRKNYSHVQHVYTDKK